MVRTYWIRSLAILPSREEALERKRQREKAERAFQIQKIQRGLCTFTEYITYCHECLSKPVVISPYDVLQRTPLTPSQMQNRDHKLCYRYLRPWDGFHQEQVRIYNRIRSKLGQSREFDTLESLREKKYMIMSRRIRSKDDLMYHLNMGIRVPVEAVLSMLGVKVGPGLSGGIEFGAERDINDNPCMAVYAVGEERRKTLLFHMLDKHSLTANVLRIGLRQPRFWENVVLGEEPSDCNGKFRFCAEGMTGTALADVYDLMMNNGLPFGVLVTGSCLVFLYVDEEMPDTLCYFLSEPVLDVEHIVNHGSDGWPSIPVTAVARIVCFCLMSLEVPHRGPNWMSRVLPTLELLHADFHFIHWHMPNFYLQYAPPASHYKPPVFRGAPRKRICSAGGLTPWRDKSASSEPPMEFCTQKCLLGLQCKGMFDWDCPNVKRHRLCSNAMTHRVTVPHFRRLLTLQLKEDLERYCERLEYEDNEGLQYRWGVPFKLTLMPHGYTVLGKGTVDRGWEEGLKREEEMYEILQPLQGSDVPVCLGSIHMDDAGYFYQRAELSHFLLLSWSGHPLSWYRSNPISESNLRKLYSAMREAQDNIYDFGVDLGRLTPPSNALWNEERGVVQIVGLRTAILRAEWRELGKRKGRDKNDAAAKRVRC